jgi:hypothetical protein
MKEWAHLQEVLPLEGGRGSQQHAHFSGSFVPEPPPAGLQPLLYLRQRLSPKHLQIPRSEHCNPIRASTDTCGYTMALVNLQSRLQLQQGPQSTQYRGAVMDTARPTDVCLQARYLCSRRHQGHFESDVKYSKRSALH